ncbi:M12 family metallopeptidase [Sphingobacterium thalpophilum]
MLVPVLLHMDIMHAIGLYHEHTRPDRDNTITVHSNRCRLARNEYKC